MNLRPITPGEDAVLSVLAGTTIEIAAAQANTTPNRLADAIERYRAAGRAALDHQPDGWYQVSVEFADYPTAERAVRVHLLPALHRESVGSWWFVRKHPCWRLRVHAAPGADIDDAVGHISHALDNAASLGAIKRWWTSLYEPETVAFGGPAGMAISHALFHTDSLGVLKHRQRGEKGARRPLDSKATSLLVTTLLLRAAGLEWGEQGDVWGRVEAARPLPDDVKPRKVSGMVNALRRLLLVDAGPLLADGPLTSLRTWVTGMEHGGRALADAAHEGRLRLGLRGILARHILFHWNRMEFTTRQQAIWSRAAREAVLGQ